MARDLLSQHHDGEHVGRVFAGMIAASLVGRKELAAAAARYARSYGLREGDGTGMLRHLTGQTARSSHATRNVRRAA